MNNLNSIILEGNLTGDPRMKYLESGTALVNFSVASNRHFKKNGMSQKEVSFFEIQAWSRLAETCAEYLKKGRKVRIVGRLKQNRWQNQEGKNRSGVIIIAEHVEFRPVNHGETLPSNSDSEILEAVY